MAARLLLALAVARHEPVRDDELIDRLWPSAAPPSAVASLRNQVARVRRMYGPTVITRVAGGYRLDPCTCRLDVTTFDLLVMEGSALGLDGDTDAAIARLDDALALVRGRPFHDVADEVWAMPATVAAGEAIGTAEELWAELCVDTGQAASEVPRLRQAAHAQPQREVRWRHLVAAYLQSGRRTEALRAVEDARRALAEFGMLPGDDLLACERDLVGLDASSEDCPRTRIPVPRSPLVGRSAELAELLRAAPVAWIEGEAGAGKSRLLAEVADRLHDLGGQTIYVACARQLGSGGLLTGALAIEALAAAGHERPPPGALAQLLGPPSEPTEPPGPTHEHQRSRLADDLAGLLRQADTTRPLTVMVDDVHWLDDAAIATVQHLVRRTTPAIRWVFASRALEYLSEVRRVRGDLERTSDIKVIHLRPLDPDALRELVSVLAPNTESDERDQLVDEVVATTGGHALYATELILHRRNGPASGDPPRLDTIVAGTVAGLDPLARMIVELLAVAEMRTPIAVLATTAGVDPSCVLEAAEQLHHEGLLSPTSGVLLEIRHELIRRGVLRQMPRSVEASRRRAFLNVLARDERYVVHYADQMLRVSDLTDERSWDAIDRAVGSALDRLMLQVDTAAARSLADRYLEADTGQAPRPHALATRLRVAMALLATGDVERGRALMLPLLDQARSAGDVLLRADAILALGPTSTGSMDAPGMAEEAEAIAIQLPAPEARRKVQLLGWAAHLRINEGDRGEALRLLDDAQSVAMQIPQKAWEALVLALRAQAGTMASTSPSQARRAYEVLCEHAARHPNDASAAAVLMLGIGRAFTDGTLDDVADMRQRLLQAVEHLPRPDLQWWPLALDAAVALATGDLDESAIAIERAAKFGHDMDIEVAEGTALIQHALRVRLAGDLPVLLPILDARSETGHSSSGALVMHGLACVEAERADQAGCIADELAVRPGLLEQSGAVWPLVASCGADLAFATSHIGLAGAIRVGLERHSGSGLCIHGAAYVGTANRALALTMATLGELDHALDLIDRAHAEEERRGTTAWACQTVADEARIRRSL